MTIVHLQGKAQDILDEWYDEMSFYVMCQVVRWDEVLCYVSSTGAEIENEPHLTIVMRKPEMACIVNYEVII